MSDCGEKCTVYIAGASARQYAYDAIYRAQKDRGDKLSWQEERNIFHKAIHEYEDKNPGKIRL